MVMMQIGMISPLLQPIAAVVSFGLTFFFWKDNTVEEEEVIIEKQRLKRKYYEVQSKDECYL